ncbi:MAG TPA: hypothetical protein VJ124_14530 [Pyrinomonadaceae bacterium]|nr:hypothetical protein [Pyrinomonadaceae bacterium]
MMLRSCPVIITVVIDQATLLQLDGLRADAVAVLAEHDRQMLLGQAKTVRLKTVTGHQEPAAGSLTAGCGRAGRPSPYTNAVF